MTAALREQYTLKEVGACRVCGTALEIVSLRHGVVKYVCGGLDWLPTFGTPERDDYDTHRALSETYVSDFGDPTVLALCNRFDALYAAAHEARRFLNAGSHYDDERAVCRALDAALGEAGE